jgi:hypothetical protein
MIPKGSNLNSPGKSVKVLGFRVKFGNISNDPEGIEFE